MNPAPYQTGEHAEVGDVVALAGQRGKVILIGEDLIEWGLTREEVEEGRVMIEFENGSLLCTDTNTEDLAFIRRRP